MHVGFVTKRFPNLSETFVLNQVTGLIDLGHDIHVFARASKATDKQHEDVTEYDLGSRTQYFGPAEARNSAFLPMRLADAVWTVLSAPTARRKKLLSIAFGEAPRPVGRRLLDLFYADELLERGLDDIEVLVCHFGPIGQLALSWKKAGIYHGKIAVIFHGYDITQYLQSRGDDVYDELFREADLLLPISENWRRRLLELGAPQERIRVHKVGVDCHRFEFRPRKLDDGNGEIRLLSIARLVEKKGIEFGIRAIDIVRQSFPNVKYRIAGDGPLKDDLQKIIAEHGLEDSVELLGWRTHEEIAALLDESHLLLAPSVTSAEGDQEGIPVALMEALAQGIPVISTRHSGIPELIRDGESGYLTEEADVKGLAAAINRLISEEARWPDMGRSGADFVRDTHEITRLNRTLSQTLREILG
ncbi:MAG: glycosyltransferase [Pseudomonadota bacterium]